MIRRLRLRMTLMVVAVLVLVSAGIVLAIHLSSQQNIAARAESALAELAMDRGEPAPAEQEADRGEPGDFRGGREQRGRRGQPREIRSGREAAAAGLSSFYTILLNGDGSVASWISDKKDLYSDEQVAAIAESALADGKDSGRIGTQFYRKASRGNQEELIVLDARVECLAASDTLRSVILVASAACVLLSALAWLLVRRMVRPVEDAFARQKQFVSDASHELKTPLAVISANAEVLEQEVGQNEYLGYIRSEVRRTDSLVRSLLALARLDRNETRTDMKPFDLGRALLDVTLPFESTVYEAGKTLEMDIPEGITCHGSEEMIKQLAVILLSNALKYSDEGGRIGITLKAAGRQREICVSNTGDPIPPENREKIFDRFWRADPARGSETGGHGLGLAIARSIVETHRGRIRVDSSPEEGTRFTVLLNA